VVLYLAELVGVRLARGIRRRDGGARLHEEEGVVGRAESAMREGRIGVGGYEAHQDHEYSLGGGGRFTHTQEREYLARDRKVTDSAASTSLSLRASSITPHERGISISI